MLTVISLEAPVATRLEQSEAWGAFPGAELPWWSFLGQTNGKVVNKMKHLNPELEKLEQRVAPDLGIGIGVGVGVGIDLTSYTSDDSSDSSS
jgi:hypothetical protein